MSLDRFAVDLDCTVPIAALWFAKPYPATGKWHLDMEQLKLFMSWQQSVLANQVRVVVAHGSSIVMRLRRLVMGLRPR
jgi:hypothetical protein